MFEVQGFPSHSKSKLTHSRISHTNFDDLQSNPFVDMILSKRNQVDIWNNGRKESEVNNDHKVLRERLDWLPRDENREH